MADEIPNQKKYKIREDSFSDDDIYGVPENPKDEYFDQIIGEIENILVEDDFMKLQKDLMERNWHHFEVI